MTYNQCLQGVVEVAEEVFSRSLVDPTLRYAKKDISEWDSLANLMVIMGIEQRFDVRFSAEQAQSFESLQQIAQYVEGEGSVKC